MLSTLQQLQHFIRTAFGDSNKSFGPTAGLHPFQGSGQGNGASGAIWAAISTVLLNILRDDGYGAQFTTTISNELTKLVGFAFVDDTDLSI